MRFAGLVLFSVMAFGIVASAQAEVPEHRHSGKLLSAVSMVPGIAEIPLMPGLAPSGGAPLVLDKPQGRLVETTVWGSVTRRAVMAFYASYLPHLGWVRQAASRYRREGQRLALDFSGRDGALAVDFTLSPL